MGIIGPNEQMVSPTHDDSLVDTYNHLIKRQLKYDRPSFVNQVTSSEAQQQ